VRVAAWHPRRGAVGCAAGKGGAMMGKGYRVLLGFLCVAVALMSGHALQAAASSHFVDLLAWVPDQVVREETGWAVARYVDYEALFASEGLAELRGFGDVEILLTSVPLGPLMGRIAAGPEPLSYLWVSAGRMAEVVGFEWLLHADRSLEFGEPPGMGLLLGGEFDRDAMATALEPRGFERRDVAGVEVWHRFEDWTISLAARELADPFGGHLGAAARIARLPGGLASGRGWGVVEAAIAASRGDIPSLADDPVSRALADAVSEPEGLLVQALLFPGRALRVRGEDWEAADPSGSLPPYVQAVLADRQEGDDQVHLVGLAYTETGAAQTAAGVLARRLAAFAVPEDSEEPLGEQLGATFSSWVREFPESGLALAVVEARYPLPDPRFDPEIGLYPVAAPLYRAWVQAIMMRAFIPLW